MAETTIQELSDIIKSAEFVLNQVFGEQPDSSIEGSSSLTDQKFLEAAYKQEMESSGIGEFQEIFKSIESMRSTYLPAEFVTQSTSSSSINGLTTQSTLGISSDLALTESHENAFMRMLGMPSSDDPFLQAAETLVTISADGSQTGETTSIEEVTTSIFDERQLDQVDRMIPVDLDDALKSLYLKEETAAVASAEGATAEEVSAAADAAVAAASSIHLHDIEQDFFKFSYLLIPPIQDARISGCISEPAKIVAPPFAKASQRLINQQPLRPSLLEVIIKIRLDRKTGVLDLGNVTETTTNGTETILSNSYGILESLFILRLRSAIGGLANRLVDLQAHYSEQAQAKKSAPKSDNPNSSQAGEPELTDQIKSPKTEFLESQLMKEDAISFMLSDNSEILSLPAQEQRSNSVHEGYLVSSLMTMVNLPRKRVEKELNEMKAKTKANSNKVMEPLREEMGQIFGTQTGVGLIDVLVFSLALFTISEESLIGLLSETAFNNLKKTTLSSSLSVQSKAETTDSVNELSLRIIQGYRAFISDIINDDVTE